MYGQAMRSDSPLHLPGEALLDLQRRALLDTVAEGHPQAGDSDFTLCCPRVCGSALRWTGEGAEGGLRGAA